LFFSSLASSLRTCLAVLRRYFSLAFSSFAASLASPLARIFAALKAALRSIRRFRSFLHRAMILLVDAISRGTHTRQALDRPGENSYLPTPVANARRPAGQYRGGADAAAGGSFPRFGWHGG